MTAICFHPRQDQYFLSGSLDGKLRLWNIPDKKVALWNEVSDGASKLITTANFIQVRKMLLLLPLFNFQFFHLRKKSAFQSLIHTNHNWLINNTSSRYFFGSTLHNNITGVFAIFLLSEFKWSLNKCLISAVF